MHSRESLPAACLENCLAANDEGICEVFDAFDSDCVGPEPSQTGIIGSQVQLGLEPRRAYDVPVERKTSKEQLVCNNRGLNKAVKELIAQTNENEGRLF